MPDQKRLLSLDGGGILGLITLGILERLEKDLRTATNGGEDFRLRDWFHYIGGTSTGAIIAAGLAIGKSVPELIRFYTESGSVMFDRASLIRRYRASYDAGRLTEKLKAEFSEDTILDLQRSGRLAEDRHLLVVTRNVNTDSPWPISTNPSAVFNDAALPDCNRLLPLWQIVRASTAAPTFFPPEVITLPNGRAFTFEDGGVTPYNNPAFLLFRMATEPAYRCGWATGEDRMMVVSVGTGLAFDLIDDPNPRGAGLLAAAASVPGRLMRGVAVEQDIACRTVGRCVHGAVIDAELGDMMAAHDPGRPKAFLYARYDADISWPGLTEMDLADIDPGALVLDNAAAGADMLRIGRRAADQVDITRQFPEFL